MNYKPLRDHKEEHRQYVMYMRLRGCRALDFLQWMEYEDKSKGSE